MKTNHLHCHCCKIPWDYVCPGPMLSDRAWARISNYQSEVLCWSCEEARAQERLGRGLRFSDLLPCPANFGYHYKEDYVRFYWGSRTTGSAEWKRICDIANRNIATGLPRKDWKWAGWIT